MKKMLSAGTVVEISTTAHEDLSTESVAAATFVDISCALTGLSGDNSEPEQIDVTSLCATKRKEYLDGLLDEDSLSSDGFFYPSSDEGRALQTVADSNGRHILRRTFNDGTVILDLCTLSQFSPNTEVGSAVTTTFNFKLKGDSQMTVPEA